MQRAVEAGYKKVIGIDEAGRGPLAGPVVVAAAHMPPGIELAGLNDSKQLTEKKRQELFDEIIANKQIDYSIIIIEEDIIDEINILQATYKGMRESANGIKDADFIFVDGKPVPQLPLISQNLIKGDSKCAAIAAASILAKVTRDQLMMDYHEQYPKYHFDKHKGYGTKAHVDALEEHGPCPIHRKSFAPVAKILNEARQGKLDL